MTKGWPASHSAVSLSGPLVVDSFIETQRDGADDLVERLVESAIEAGASLHNWSEEDARAFRSSAWRSAHRFLLQYIETVDRSTDFNDLAKLLRVNLDEPSD